MKSFAKYAVVLLLVLVAVLNISVMAIGLFGINAQMDLIPGALLKIESGSMEPSIKTGDMIVVWEAPYGSLEVGDVVTFHQGNELVTHEIVRAEGSRYVTKGTANNQEDASIGPEEYCAKMLFTIPGGGIVIDILTAPAGLVLSVILILFIFYGMPVIEKVKEKKEDIRIGSVRVAASAAAISMLTVTPFITAAKYVSNINQFTTAVAAAKYFSSNYISKEGTSYDIKGWNGEHYSIPLVIKNYDNSLLFNESGRDLTYHLRLEKIVDDSGMYKGDYNIKLDATNVSSTYNEEIKGSSTTYGPFVLTGMDDRGKSHSFTVNIEAHTTSDGDCLLKAKDKIHFKIYAFTESTIEYDQQLMGDFILEVATGESFIGSREGWQQEGTSLVTYSIKTNQIEGNGTRDVKISWNKEKMYINAYESTVQNLMASNPDAIVYDEKDADGHFTGRGYIILPLQAYSNVSLQFFKYDAKETVRFEEYFDDDGVGHVADIYVVEKIDDVFDEPVAPTAGPVVPTPGEGDGDDDEKPVVPTPGEGDGDGDDNKDNENEENT